MVRWPEWWSWEIEFLPHVLKRMVDRRISETDLRALLEKATRYREDIEEGRWVIAATLEGRAWETIVEPLVDEEILLIVTVYPVV